MIETCTGKQIVLGQAGLGVGVGVLVVWEAAFRKQIMQGEIKKAENNPPNNKWLQR